MDLEPFRELLRTAINFYQPRREQSVFALGGRGYYENPTTDLLAFFLDPEESHDLGDCFLASLLECIPGTAELNPFLRENPKREVLTHANNRIDLVLAGDGWDLVLENKIFHGQVNPFDDYEAFATQVINGDDRTLLYTVLSPSGQSSRPAWHGLSYGQLIGATRQRLAHQMLNNPINKWQVIARDFLLHLENLTMEKAMDANAINFVIENLSQINNLVRLKDKVIDALDGKVVEALEREVPNYERYTRRHNWKNGPALRFASDNWKTWSDVVLYLRSSSSTVQPSIRVYLCEMDDSLRQQGLDLFVGGETEVWHEGKGNSILCLRWELEHFDEEEIISLIVEKMKLLMHFEQDLRR